MADSDKLVTIISGCLAVDKTAAAIYGELAQAAEDRDLGDFWQGMSGEELEHVDFWQKLLQLAEEGAVPQVFAYPDRVIQELQQIQKKVDALHADCRNLADVSRSFLMALRLEFYLMHPAFEQLFHFMLTIDREKNPETRYEDHINKFIDALNRFGAVTPELELLGESLQHLWRENKALAQQCTNDELTGVLNRKGFFQAIKPLSHLAERNDFVVGIIMADIDSFKKVNDTNGHLKGDEVIQRVAAILKANVRASDIVGRYGGEEFIIYLSSIDGGMAFALADKIRAKVEAESVGGIRVTISLGASFSVLGTDIDDSLRQLIADADSALYRAKNAGRNRVVVQPGGDRPSERPVRAERIKPDLPPNP